MSSSNRKDPSLDGQHQAILSAMQKQKENRQCADCHGPAPRWASTNLGCFLCISCSGIHRKIGVHVSVIRSVTLDTWTSSQVAHFRELGNLKSTEIYESYLPEGFCRPTPSNPVQMERFIRDKYEKKVFTPVEHGGAGGVSMQKANPREKKHLPSQYFGTGAELHAPPRHPFRSSSSLPSSTRNISRRLGVSEYRIPQNNSRFENPTGQWGSPFRRADAMKTILEMGFSAQVAARALEASNDNLHDAVDWVLQNEPSARSISAEMSRESHARNGVIDYRNPGAHVEAIPIVERQQPALPSSSSKADSTLSDLLDTHPPSHSNDFEDDFADFGAFQSALPETELSLTPQLTDAPSSVQSVSEAKVATSEHKVTSRLASAGISLSDLYAKGRHKESAENNIAVEAAGQFRDAQAFQVAEKGKEITPVNGAQSFGVDHFLLSRRDPTTFPPRGCKREISQSPDKDKVTCKSNGLSLFEEIYKPAESSPQAAQSESICDEGFARGSDDVNRAEILDKKPDRGADEDDPFADLAFHALKSARKYTSPEECSASVNETVPIAKHQSHHEISLDLIATDMQGDVDKAEYKMSTSHDKVIPAVFSQTQQNHVDSENAGDSRTAKLQVGTTKKFKHPLDSLSVDNILGI